MCQCLTLKSLPFYLDGKAVCKHYFSICISQVENARIPDIKVKYKELPVYFCPSNDFSPVSEPVV